MLCSFARHVATVFTHTIQQYIFICLSVYMHIYMFSHSSHIKFNVHHVFQKTRIARKMSTNCYYFVSIAKACLKSFLVSKQGLYALFQNLLMCLVLCHQLTGYFAHRGMYVCRTLSFKGADFTIDEVPLEVKMQVSNYSLLFKFHIASGK